MLQWTEVLNLPVQNTHASKNPCFPPAGSAALCPASAKVEAGMSSWQILTSGIVVQSSNRGCCLPVRRPACLSSLLWTEAKGLHNLEGGMQPAEGM